MRWFSDFFEFFWVFVQKMTGFRHQRPDQAFFPSKQDAKIFALFKTFLIKSVLSMKFLRTLVTDDIN